MPEQGPLAVAAAVAAAETAADVERLVLEADTSAIDIADAEG
eukprot:SAG22_NODE_6922_length_794_cov_4.546763_2_plen_42_part_00